jgi:hypothetical protein
LRHSFSVSQNRGSRTGDFAYEQLREFSIYERPRISGSAGGCLVAKAASFRPEATNTAFQRTLRFADRVANQHAIEGVYWLHRIWPKENLGPKPSIAE